MKLVLKILALPVLFVVKVICVLGNLLTNVVSYVIGLPSPTQVGDAGRVRELTYWYRVGSVSVCGTALPCPRFSPHR